MRFKAVLTTLLVLGTSSAAMAHPRFSRSSSTTYSDRPYGYQVQPVTQASYAVQTFAYGQNPYQANIARDQWSLLATSMNLAGGQTSLSLGNARFAAIELQAERGGGSFIREVIVTLDDGRQVRVTPMRPLDPEHAPNLRIDLGAGLTCGIRSVSIVGDGNPWARFRVIAG